MKHLPCRRLAGPQDAPFLLPLALLEPHHRVLVIQELLVLQQLHGTGMRIRPFRGAQHNPLKPRCHVNRMLFLHLLHGFTLHRGHQHEVFKATLKERLQHTKPFFIGRIHHNIIDMVLDVPLFFHVPFLERLFLDEPDNLLKRECIGVEFSVQHKGNSVQLGTNMLHMGNFLAQPREETARMHTADPVQLGLGIAGKDHVFPALVEFMRQHGQGHGCINPFSSRGCVTGRRFVTGFPTGFVIPIFFHCNPARPRLGNGLLEMGGLIFFSNVFAVDNGLLIDLHFPVKKPANRLNHCLP